MKIGLDTKYLRSVLAYFLVAVCAVILVFYFCYHLFNGFTAEVQTVTAISASEEDVITREAYLLRDETLIRSNYGGVVDYAVEDGERVGVNALLAEVYAASDDGSVRRQAEAIDEEIALLAASNIGEGVVISDTAATDAKISSLLYAIRENLFEGNYDYARRETDSLLIQLNKRKIITGQVQNYDARIAALTVERENLTARLQGASQTIHSTESGYFFYGADGYEGIFSVEGIDRLTLGGFDAMRAAPAAAVSANTIGKMVSSYLWYIAVPMHKTELDAFGVGNTYEISFPYHYGLTLRMTLERVLTEAEREDAVLLFSCTDMPGEFTYLRTQNVELTLRVREGLRVPSEAIRVIDGETCVYVVRGGKVELRRVVILLEREGDCIVEAGLSAEKDTVPYLALYDEVVISGKDLYDGKVLK